MVRRWRGPLPSPKLLPSPGLPAQPLLNLPQPCWKHCWLLEGSGPCCGLLDSSFVVPNHSSSVGFALITDWMSAQCNSLFVMQTNSGWSSKNMQYQKYKTAQFNFKCSKNNPLKTKVPVRLRKPGACCLLFFLVVRF